MKNIVISFDLDFTLINNQIGILNSFEYAFKEYNLPLPEPQNLVKTIGLPLKRAFQKFTDFNPDKLITSFRDYYSDQGIFQVELYPNVPKLLKKLKQQNYKLGVVTSKKQEMAVKLLKFLNLHNYFDFIIGETEDIKQKTDPKIKTFFQKNFPDHFYLIIGDNISDKNLAIMLKSPFIGLLTGSTSRSELEQGDLIPIFILESISKLTDDIIVQKIHLCRN